MSRPLHKVVNTVPSKLEPDSLYLVRRGRGFDLLATNKSGVLVAYPLNQPAFGRNASFTQALNTTTRTSTDWYTKLDLGFTVGAADAGLYKLEWSYSWNYDGTGDNFLARFSLNNQVFREHHQEPKDAAGNYGGTGSDQRKLVSSFTYLTLAAGTYSFKIQFRPERSSKRASMWDCSAGAYLVQEGT